MLSQAEYTKPRKAEWAYGLCVTKNFRATTRMIASLAAWASPYRGLLLPALDSTMASVKSQAGRNPGPKAGSATRRSDGATSVTAAADTNQWI